MGNEAAKVCMKICFHSLNQQLGTVVHHFQTNEGTKIHHYIISPTRLVQIVKCCTLFIWTIHYSSYVNMVIERGSMRASFSIKENGSNLLGKVQGVIHAGESNWLKIVDSTEQYCTMEHQLFPKGTPVCAE